MKLTYGLTKHINTYINQIIQPVFSIYIQPRQVMLILGEDDNVSGNFGVDKIEKFTF